MKVLKNFTCNGVRKKAGQFLSKEDKELIGGKFGEQLMKDDFIQGESKQLSEEEKAKILADKDEKIAKAKLDKDAAKKSKADKKAAKKAAKEAAKKA